MNRIIKFVILDILKNKVVLFYTLILAALSWSVFALEDNSTKGLLTLLNVILLVVPLVSVIFATIYLYNSAEFIELLLSQPVKRSRIWFSLILGLSISLMLAFFFGAGIAILMYVPFRLAIMMLVMGLTISCVFVSIAFLGSVITRDKAKGIGIAIMLWLFFALLFDGILLFLLFQFSDYPIEKLVVFMSSMNPIDLARIMILLDLDVSAMMGYTGAIFKEYFGTLYGASLAALILFIWILIPYQISLFKFRKKDL